MSFLMRSAIFAITAGFTGWMCMGGMAWASCNGASPNICTDSFTSNVKFDVSLSVSKNADISFGTVQQNSCTYSIDTAGTVTGSPSGNCSYVTGTKTVGNLSITGSSTQAITISANSYTASSTVTPSAATGKYGLGSEASLPMNVAAPGSSGTALLLGITVTTNGTETIGTTYTPTFTITVAYQ